MTARPTIDWGALALDEGELRRLKAIADSTVTECLTKEYEPGLLEIDRARQRRNPAYFTRTCRALWKVAIRSWALGDIGAARSALDLMPDMLAEALSFDWRPHAADAKHAIAVAVITGRRSLVPTLVAADRGLTSSGGGDKHANSVTWWNRCVGDLVRGDDSAVRSRLQTAVESVDALAFKSDQDLVMAHVAILGAIVDADPAALDRAARTQNDRVVAFIAALAEPEQSSELIAAPTTALLAVARRRGMAIPEDLPTCPAVLIAPEWAD